MDIQKEELGNGLVVVSEAMPHLRSVAIGVWVRCGSRYEKPGESGISHFIEHLVFKGTKKRTAEEIAKRIDAIGGQLDAFTDKEVVGFIARVLDEHIGVAFELLADIARNPLFPRQELEKERNVIFEEISGVEDTPQEVIHEMFLESFWPEHPLGKPIAGSRESVGKIGRRQIVEYYERGYRAARNIVISVAGNIRHDKIVALAKRHFGSLAAGEKMQAGPAPNVRYGRSIRNKKGLEQTQICLGVACPERISEERYCMHLLSNILGGGMSSRLFQNIREKRGLVYGIDSVLELYHDAGSLIVSAASAPKKAGEVIGLVMKEFRHLRENLVGDEELKRAKACLKGSLMLGLESSGSRMTYLAQQEIDFGRLFELGELLDRIDRVRRRDIRDLAQSIFRESIAVAILGNGSAGKMETFSLRSG